MKITRSELKEMINKVLKEELLKEDEFSTLEKATKSLVVGFTPASVLGTFLSAIKDMYYDKKITKSYVNKMINALNSAPNQLKKFMSKIDKEK